MTIVPIWRQMMAASDGVMIQLKDDPSVRLEFVEREACRAQLIALRDAMFTGSNACKSGQDVYAFLTDAANDCVL
jgi:hypothetical protein